MTGFTSSLLSRSATVQSPRRRKARSIWSRPWRGLTARPWLEMLEQRTLLSNFTVTNSGDNGGVNPLPGAGTGTLRQAIIDADAVATGTAASPDQIQFNIPTSDPGYHSSTSSFSIRPLSALPTITDTVILDGYTEPGASPNTLAIGDNAVLKIVLDGSLAGSVDGLVITAGNCTVRGVVIDNFAVGTALVLNGTGNDIVVGNFIGTDVTGESAAANNVGISPNNAAGYRIGGTSPGDRNLISGNNSTLPDTADGGGNPLDIGIGGGNGSLIEGNSIGTDKSGTSALPNTSYGIVVGSNNTIGGTATGAGNVISGNGLGIFMGSQNLVAGNLIGTTATGLAGLGNGYGIDTGGNNNTIGGTIPGARNIISGNDGNASYGIGFDPSIGSCQYNLVEGNYIGTDITGTKGLSGQVNGILLGGAYNTIGGTTPAARNIIAAVGDGISINSSSPPRLAFGNVVQGNYIGTDASGTQALPNGVGIHLEGGTYDNTIGGAVPGAGNVISGKSNGTSIHLQPYNGGIPTNNIIQGNLIGTDATGTVALGSGGVDIESGNNNTIGGTAPGAGNTIAFSTGNGVYVYSGTGNSILGNSIFSNASQGIFLNSANNANNNQAFPVLTGVSSSSSGTTISGMLQSVANTTFRVEFFANATADPSGYGQGQTFLGFTTVTTNSSGAGNFTVTLTTPLPKGQTILSATATNLTTGDTSQFCKDFSVPIVGPISAPLDPVAVNTTISVSASFTDANTTATHTAVWSWGDPTTSPGTVTETNGSGTVTGSHTYAADGVYTITLTVTNNVGGSGQSVFQFVVIYNPNGGFVTGGGWITSPVGAYLANPTLTGRANFGFNSAYKPGRSVPDGDTEFQFQLGNLDFHSTSYDWLTIINNMAQYQGNGTINGAGNYKFVLTSVDGDLLGGTDPDTFRIRIWDPTVNPSGNGSNYVYDNYPSGHLYNDPSGTPLGGGEIVIHSGGGPAPPPGGGAARPQSPSITPDPTPVTTVQLSPPVAVVDRFFSLLGPETPGIVPHGLKRHGQGEEVRWLLEILPPEGIA